MEAIDFLLKPISFDRFLKAVNKAYELLRATNGISFEQDFIFVKVDHKLVKVYWNEIFYIQAMENYLCLYTSHKRYIIHKTLKSIMENISSDKFIQVHRSYVIQVPKITGVNGNVIELGTFQIPVSRNYKDRLMEKVVNSNLLQ